MTELSTEIEPADAAQEVDAALREARMLLSMLSAPALRAGIGAALQGEAPTDPAVAGPLSRLAWLAADGAVDHALLRARVDALGTLLGDGAILSARRLTSLPVTEEERRELAGRIAELEARLAQRDPYPVVDSSGDLNP